MKYTKEIRSKIFKLTYKFVNEPLVLQSRYDDFIQQGLTLGNAVSDPYNMLNYGDYAYQTGLIDEHGRRRMKIFEFLAKEHINDAYGKIVRMFPSISLNTLNHVESVSVLGGSIVYIY